MASCRATPFMTFVFLRICGTRHTFLNAVVYSPNASRMPGLRDFKKAVKVERSSSIAQFLLFG